MPPPPPYLPRLTTRTVMTSGSPSAHRRNSTVSPDFIRWYLQKADHPCPSRRWYCPDVKMASYATGHTRHAGSRMVRVFRNNGFGRGVAATTSAISCPKVNAGLFSPSCFADVNSTQAAPSLNSCKPRQDAMSRVTNMLRSAFGLVTHRLKTGRQSFVPTGRLCVNGG